MQIHFTLIGNINSGNTGFVSCGATATHYRICVKILLPIVRNQNAESSRDLRQMSSSVIKTSATFL
jgi:hypothetical protein